MGSGAVVAVLVGAGIAVQVAIIGRAASTANPLAVSLALQLAGSAVAAAWATSRGVWAEVVGLGREWWWLPLGAGGWMFVAGIAYASRQAGPAVAVSVLVASQIGFGLVLDATSGSRSVGPREVLATGLIVLGVVVLTMPGQAAQAT